MMKQLGDQMYALRAERFECCAAERHNQIESESGAYSWILRFASSMGTLKFLFYNPIEVVDDWVRRSIVSPCHLISVRYRPHILEYWL